MFHKRRSYLKAVVSDPDACLQRGEGAFLTRIGGEHVLQRLRRKRHASKRPVPRHVMREPKMAAQSKTLDQGIYLKALRTVGGLPSIPCLPREYGPSNLSAPHSRDGVSRDRKANVEDDARKSDIAHTNDGLATVSHRGREATIAHRHCAASPHGQSKRRNTYIVGNEHAAKQKALEKQLNMNSVADSISPLHLGATMVDLRSDLEWLSPGANFDRDFGLLEKTTNEEYETLNIEAMRLEEMDDEFMATDIADGHDRNAEEGMRNGSLPELDSEYQTSDDDLSIPDDLAANHLTPAQTMLNLLPVDIDGRFGSFYSDANEFRSHILNDQNETIYANAEMCQSRFSWGSSTNSDAGLSSVSEGDVWWKPIKPLVVVKDPPKPPPIPQRNPLRLLRRTSKGTPKGFGENVRGSRNIHNLHLDLSRLSKSDVRTSQRSSVSNRRRSHGPAKKEKPKLATPETWPHLAIPGHILQAMRDSGQSVEVPSKIGDNKKARWSIKSSTSSKTHSGSRSTKEVTSRFGCSDKLKTARGHIRAASDPSHNKGVRNSSGSKWNASMPSHGCIRRTCIPGLANVGNRRKLGQALAINKSLPPLPAPVEIT
jgi:hypothetical protein